MIATITKYVTDGTCVWCLAQGDCVEVAFGEGQALGKLFGQMCKRCHWQSIRVRGLKAAKELESPTPNGQAAPPLLR
jgi:hypothetical protein